MKRSLSFLLVSFLLSTHLIAVDTPAQRVANNLNDAEVTGLQLLAKDTDWRNFWAEFSISGKSKYCPTTDVKKNIIGFEATLFEPLYIIDATVSPNEVKSIGLTLGMFRPDISGTMTKSGGMRVNIFMFSIPAIVFKKEMEETGIFAFEKGSPKVVYLAALDPFKFTDIIKFKMIPERGIMATAIGALAGAGSCVANSALGVLSPHYKRDSSAGKQLRSAIDSLYFVVGCTGFVPTGTIPSNDDPIVSGIQGIASLLADMHSKKGVVNALEVSHVTQNVLNNYSKDILCTGEQRFIHPMTQNTIQLVYPTVGSTRELGESAIEYAFKNGLSTGRTAMYIGSQRRDYAAMAYRGGYVKKESAAPKE